MFDFILKNFEKSIFELLKDILFEDNLSPFLRIGVFEEKNKRIILDGNRRIICLKILLMLSKKWKLIKSLKIVSFLNKNKEKILNFQKNFKEINQNKLEVVKFINRVQGKEWLLKLHTHEKGYTSEDWKTFERKLHIGNIFAIFINSKMKEYNISRDIYVKHVSFAIWERIFSILLFRDFFSIEIHKKIIKIKNEEDFKRKINIMIELIRIKEINFNDNFFNKTQVKETIKIIENQLKIF